MALSEGKSTIVVGALDITILLLHLYRLYEKDGNMDAINSVEEIEKRMKFSIRLPLSIVESCLYSCNMLSEQGEFWHPRMNCESFLAKVCKGRKYNRTYHYIGDKSNDK